jgi:DnaJ-class molecular chaperone
MKCMNCDGKGVQHRQINPFMLTTLTCGSCGGKGTMIKHGKECSACHGNKVLQVKKSIDIKIPKGVPSNHTHVAKEKGSYDINSGRNVDLVMIFQHNIQSDALSVRVDERHNVHITFDVKLEEVLCGFERVVNLYGFDICISTPGYINPINTYKIEEMGLPMHKGTTGDLYIKLQVKYPDDTSRINKYQDVFAKLFKNPATSLDRVSDKEKYMFVIS